MEDRVAWYKNEVECLIAIQNGKKLCLLDSEFCEWVNVCCVVRGACPRFLRNAGSSKDFHKFDEEDEWEERGLDKFLNQLKECKNCCPKCEHLSSHYHVRHVKENMAVVDWICENCGHTWSNSCLSKNGKVVFGGDVCRLPDVEGADL